MKIKRSLVAPLMVAGVALASGGWLLQRGASPEQNIYLQARLFEEVLHHVSDKFVDEKEPSQLYKMAIDGMLTELGDPHSVFMTPEDYEKLRIQTQGEYGGLGIQIDVRDGWVTVLTPLPGTPGERAGLQAGDKIIEVDGVTTKGWNADDAVAKLRGPKGQAVNLKIGRIGVDEPIPFRIVRDEIHVKSVPAAYLLDNGVGYIELSVFSESSTQELKEAIDGLKAKGMRGLILDLRGNPGGLLDQGVSVSDLFLPEGKLVTEMRGRMPSANHKFGTSDPDMYPGMPMVVLVGPYAASASEIVAGALQDHDRALLLGQQTFGKGSVQTLFPLAGDNFLKLTTSRWYTPSGRSIQKPYGIDSNRVVGASGEDGDSASADTAKLERFRTAGGRVVLGGGGIFPDVTVQPDTLSLQEQTFRNAVAKSAAKFRDAVYRYSVRYGHDHGELKPGFQVSPAMLDGFYKTLTDAGIAVDRSVYDDASRWISYELAYQVAYNKWGPAEAKRVLNAQDNQIRAAADLLRKARDPQSLLAAAAQMPKEQAAAAAKRN
jgi:carboxyl-terminal processing protease